MAGKSRALPGWGSGHVGHAQHVPGALSSGCESGLSALSRELVRAAAALVQVFNLKASNALKYGVASHETVFLANLQAAGGL